MAGKKGRFKSSYVSLNKKAFNWGNKKEAAEVKISVK